MKVMPFLLSTSPPPALYPLAANPLGECSSDSSWPSTSPPPLLMHYFVGQVIWILTLMPPWLKVSIIARRQLISGCLTFGRNPWSIMASLSHPGGLKYFFSDIQSFTLNYHTPRHISSEINLNSIHPLYLKIFFSSS